MTAFNAIYYRNCVIIVMDTLGMIDEKFPMLFTSKMYPILHLKGIICGTGVGNFIQDWANRVNSTMLVHDIIHLNEFAPTSLKDLASDGNYNFASTTSTVYHFGYSFTDKLHKGYAYRSVNGFISEPLQYGFLFKPATSYSMPEGEIDYQTGIAELVKATLQQKEEQDSLPRDKRVFIGGEIQFAILQEGNISMGTCYQFPDWNETYSEMCEQLAINKGLNIE
jgi:hypothetical protein